MIDNKCFINQLIIKCEGKGNNNPTDSKTSVGFSF